MSYKKAGVDIEAGEIIVKNIENLVTRTFNSRVVGKFGSFAGLYDLSDYKNFDAPILVTSTDGVGTKIEIAKKMNKFNTIGVDLVGMILNDVIVTGAKPLFLTDYIAVGKIDQRVITEIMIGISEACSQADCVILGGETAEHPGVMKEDDIDLAGAAVGVVEKSKILGPQKVKSGDIIFALPSSGLHSNGFSLVRNIFKDWDLTATYEGLGAPLGEILLNPTNVYVQEILAISDLLKDQLHSVSHITGGGIAANVARVISEGLHAKIYRKSWTPQNIFQFLSKTGNISRIEMEKTFNMGVGMIIICDPEAESVLEEKIISPLVKIGIIEEAVKDATSDALPKGGRGGLCSLLGDYSGEALNE